MSIDEEVILGSSQESVTLQSVRCVKLLLYHAS